MSTKVLFWNDEAMECNRIDFSGGSDNPPENGGPTLSSRALALAHLAMNDAFFSIQGGHSTYLSYPPAAADLDAETAAAAAMHEALVQLFPRQSARLEERWVVYTSLFGEGDDPSLAHGRSIASQVIRHRKNDKIVDGSYVPKARTDHRADPTNATQKAHGAQYGANPLFLTKQRYHLDQIPVADLPRAFEEVRTLGGEAHANATLRTADQTVQAYFWAYDGVKEIGTPPRLYNQVARAIIAAHGDPNDPVECVRVLCLVNAAMGDAGILAWAEKYTYRYYRPVIGIREADPAMGPGAVPAATLTTPYCDPAWLPLGAPRSNTSGAPFTPPFPAYPSGHATFGAAAFQALRLYYRNKLKKGWGERDPDDLAFDLVSDELNGKTFDRAGVRSRHVRHFDSLWTAMRENAYSRVLLGVHWSFDAFATGDPKYTQEIGGVPLGLHIAEDIATNWQ